MNISTVAQNLRNTIAGSIIQRTVFASFVAN